MCNDCVPPPFPRLSLSVARGNDTRRQGRAGTWAGCTQRPCTAAKGGAPADCTRHLQCDLVSRPLPLPLAVLDCYRSADDEWQQRGGPAARFRCEAHT
eukprot:gene56865-biopygen114323